MRPDAAGVKGGSALDFSRQDRSSRGVGPTFEQELTADALQGLEGGRWQGVG